MKYLAIDIFLSALFLVVLGLGFFGYIGFFFVSVMLFALLVMMLSYKVESVEEEMSDAFVEKEKSKEDASRRRLVIDRMIARVDFMVSLVKRLRVGIRNFFYELD